MEFRKLRKTVEDMGWLKTNPWFYVAHFVHLIVMMVIAGSIMRIYGTGWLPYIASAVMFATFQVTTILVFSRSSQCSTTGVTKAVVCVILSVG